MFHKVLVGSYVIILFQFVTSTETVSYHQKCVVGASENVADFVDVLVGCSIHYSR